MCPACLRRWRVRAACALAAETPGLRYVVLAREVADLSGAAMEGLKERPDVQIIIDRREQQVSPPWERRMGDRAIYVDDATLDHLPGGPKESKRPRPRRRGGRGR